MKYSTSFGVYPAILGVGACVCVAEEGYSPLRVRHSPLTLFHASFLPICSTFPHSSLPLLNSGSHSIPSFLLKPIPTLSPLSLSQSKICKRSWVLHECVERVPENVDAAKELLQYGLKGTDLEALIAIGNREDGGR